MQEFLAVYTGSPSSESPGARKWNALNEEERAKAQQRGLDAWHRWMETHGKSVVYTGGPLGRTKRVSADGIADTRNELSGFVVVRAESHEAAAKMFEDHPHFSIFPGDAVEIMPCLPIPGQEG